MKSMLSFLKPYRSQAILGPLFKLLESTLELLVPLVVAAIIDNGIRLGDRGYIIRLCLVLAGLGLLGLVCSVTAQYFAARASVGFVARVRHSLFSKILDFAYSDLDRVGIPTLITRMTADLNQVQTGLNLTLRLLLRSPFVVFGAMVMAFTIDTRAALWFLAVIPILSVVVFGIMLVSMPLYKRVQDSLDSVLGATRENLTGARVLRAFGKEQDEIQAFAAKNQQLTQTQRTVGRVAALLNPMTYVIINVAIVLLIHTGAIRVEQGLLTKGAVVALYNYMSQILVELIKLANLIINITKSVACARRVQAVLETPAGEHTDPSLPGGDARFRVEFEHAGLRYAGAGDEALTDVNLRVLPGQTVGIIGGTGSGKTSLVQLVARLYPATSGRVLVDGRDVKSLDPNALRSRIGIVPQKAVVFQGTIRDNLLWGNANASDEALLEAAELAQAGDVIRAKGGLDGVIEQSGRNLSGGQKQRLTIARALVRRPEILILDDSASALDYATDAALRTALRGLDYHPTVFLVSQRASSIIHADQIVVLEDGRVAGLGTHTQLLAGCAVYREIYDSQYKKEDGQ